MLSVPPELKAAAHVVMGMAAALAVYLFIL
jgi:hypothetical protein